MVLDGAGDRFILALRLRVIAAHQALHFREFTDHFGEQIRLGELRRALGLVRIGLHQRRQLFRQRDDALDALGLGAELLVEHDLLEFRQPRVELGLQVGLVEELGIAQSRANDALIAGDDLLAAVRRFLIRHQDEFVGQLAGLRIAQHEAFLVVADGGADHLGRDRQERLVERAHQHHRPFDQPRDLGDQPLVLNQLVALRESEVLGVG